jgi:hypothetical protein
MLKYVLIMAGLATFHLMALQGQALYTAGKSWFVPLSVAVSRSHLLGVAAAMSAGLVINFSDITVQREVGFVLATALMVADVWLIYKALYPDR